MMLLNLTYLHCLQHSLFEHLFNLYVMGRHFGNIQRLYIGFKYMLMTHTTSIFGAL